MRRWMWLAGVGGAAACALGVAAMVLLSLRAGADAPVARAGPVGSMPRPVRVAEVRLEPAASVARYAAAIRPRVEAELGFRVEGKIVERLVDVGDQVSAGAALARLDPIDLELRTAAAEAQLVSARAEAANARLEFGRYRELRAKGWSTTQELEARQAAEAVATARVGEAEAALRIARNNLAYATLRADRAGIVVAVLAEPGQVVEPSDPVLRLAHAGELEAEAEVPEQDVAAFRRAELEVRLWAQPEMPLVGKLRELSLSADPATRTYTARVTLDDPPDWVRLGMTANLIARHGLSGAVQALLPPSALTQAGGGPAVWVVVGGRLELRPVNVAAYKPDSVVISAGLGNGERVVTAGVHKLDADQRVRVWSEPQR